MFEETVGDAQVSLTVLEINWVDLMRHCAGADFSFDRLLFEIALGDILPHIATETDEDGVTVSEFCCDMCETIVRLYLSGVWVELNTQLLCHKALGDLSPIDIRIREVMSVVVSDSAINLPCDRHRSKAHQLHVYAISEVGELLTQRSGTGRLPMCVCQHGMTRPFLAFGNEIGTNLCQLGNY